MTAAQIIFRIGFLLFLFGNALFYLYEAGGWKYVWIYQKQEKGNIHVVKDADGGLHRVTKKPNDDTPYRKGDLVNVYWTGTPPHDVTFYLWGFAHTQEQKVAMFLGSFGLMLCSLSYIIDHN